MENASAEILLVAEIFVAGDKNIEPPFEPRQQESVYCARESFILDSRHGMIWKDVSKRLGQILVEDNPHDFVIELIEEILRRRRDARRETDRGTRQGNSRLSNSPEVFGRERGFLERLMCRP